MVRECYQSLILAPVVPVQGPARKESYHDIEDALEAFHLLLRGQRLVVATISREELGRRELFWIPGHHDALATKNGCNGVLRQDLTGLVEDNHVEILGLSSSK